MNLEDVFRISGVPTHTFVEPQLFGAIKVSLRTPGRCLVLEGPSGIGKTSTIVKGLEAIGVDADTMNLSARRVEDVELIAELPGMKDIGNVVIDDFHRLDGEVKSKIADFMKVLADSGDAGSKLILVGINKAGNQLIEFANDLGLRVDFFKMESNSDDKLAELVSLGEAALNISISSKSDLIQRAHGSFHIAQVLCHYACLEAGVTESTDDLCLVNTSIDVTVDRVMDTFSRQFMAPSIEFARGSKIRKEGRAPYLHVLKWLSESDDWSLDLKEALRMNPDHKGSVGQIVDKGHLSGLLSEKEDVLGPHFHFEPSTSILSVEDPKLIFFLRNIGWRNFSKRVGYTADYFKGRYDIALSFAGADRDLASIIFEKLSDREVSVFYDENEQHRIVAQSVEDYLAPIYKTEARYVLALLSEHYPTRIWTKFESDIFKQRFGDGSVIAVKYTNLKPGIWAEQDDYGSLSFNPELDIEGQAENIVEIVSKKLIEENGG